MFFLRKTIFYSLILMLSASLLSILPPARAEKVELNLWSTLTQEERVTAMNSIIKKFERENPNVTIKMQVMPWGGAMDKMVSAIMAGNPPDISTVGQGWPQSLAGTGGILPLDDVVSRLGGLEMFVGTSLKVLGSLNNVVWSVPIYVTPHGLFYRKSWLAEKGLREPTTWEEFAEVAKKITEPAKNQYAFSIPFDIHGGKAVWAWLLSNDVTIFVPGDKGKWKLDFYNDRTIETYEFLYRVHKDGAPKGAPSYTGKDVMVLFAQGTLGFYYETPHVLDEVKKTNPKMLADVGYTPVPPKRRKGSGQGWVGFVIYKTPRSEQAKKFAEFMFREDNLIEFTLSFPYIHTPAYKPVLESKRYIEGLPPELKPVIARAPEVLAWSAGISLWHGPNPWAGEIEAKMILPKALSRMLVDGWTADRSVREAEEQLSGLMR